MKLDLMKYGPLRRDITKLLRDAIIRGEMQPGERLVEPELAEKLGVSRTPVREALLKLESEGFLRVFPRKGAVVAPYSIKEVNEIYEVLIEIEALAARNALMHMNADNFQEIASLERVFEEAHDQMTKIEANSRFHQYYIALCTNQILAKIVTNLNDKLDRYRRLVFIDAGRVISGQLEHKQIIQAFKQKDAAKVYKLIKRHLALSRKCLIATLEKIKLEEGTVED